MLIPSIQPGIDVAATNPIRILLCFFPPSSLIFYISMMGALETEGVGLNFSSLEHQTNIYLSFTGVHILIGILASCVIYAFLTFYIDNVSPFQQGVPKPFYFLYMPSYWCPKKSDPADEISDHENPYRDARIYEPEPLGLNPMVNIKNLTKTFSGKKKSKHPKKPAVDQLWLNIYENQITVLLGHNGAGKTTTMNMITGRCWEFILISELSTNC